MARFIIVGKNGFKTNLKDDVRASVSGHASVLIPQLADFLLDLGHDVSFVFPRAPHKNAQQYVCGPSAPPKLRLFPYGSAVNAKTPNSEEIEAFITSMGSAFGSDPDAGQPTTIISVYGFPFAPMVEALRTVKDFTHIVLIRGSDGQRWLSPKSGLSDQTSSDGRVFLSAWYKAGLAKADKIFTASDWLKTTVEEHGIKVDGIVPTPPFVTAPQDAKAAGKKVLAALSAQNVANLDSNKLLLFAGRDSTEKRPDLAIEAFNQWNEPGWSLVMLGLETAPPDIKYDPARVGFGVVSPQDLHAVMHCCDGFVHTSIPTDDFEDARPSAVSMAASAGCPVIFPLRVGGVAECFSPENAAHLGYIWNGTDADTVRNIVAKLRLLTNSGLTQQIASSNLAHSKDVQPKQVFTQLTKHLAP